MADKVFAKGAILSRVFSKVAHSKQAMPAWSNVLIPAAIGGLGGGALELLFGEDSPKSGKLWRFLRAAVPGALLGGGIGASAIALDPLSSIGLGNPAFAHLFPAAAGALGAAAGKRVGQLATDRERAGLSVEEVFRRAQELERSGELENAPVASRYPARVAGVPLVLPLALSANMSPVLPAFALFGTSRLSPSRYVVLRELAKHRQREKKAALEPEEIVPYFGLPPWAQTALDPVVFPGSTGFVWPALGALVSAIRGKSVARGIAQGSTAAAGALGGSFLGEVLGRLGGHALLGRGIGGGLGLLGGYLLSRYLFPDYEEQVLEKKAEPLPGSPGSEDYAIRQVAEHALGLSPAEAGRFAFLSSASNDPIPNEDDRLRGLRPFATIRGQSRTVDPADYARLVGLLAKRVPGTKVDTLPAYGAFYNDIRGPVYLWANTWGPIPTQQPLLERLSRKDVRIEDWLRKRLRPYLPSDPRKLYAAPHVPSVISAGPNYFSGFWYKKRPDFGLGGVGPAGVLFPPYFIAGHELTHTRQLPGEVLRYRTRWVGPAVERLAAEIPAMSAEMGFLADALHRAAQTDKPKDYRRLYGSLPFYQPFGTLERYRQALERFGFYPGSPNWKPDKTIEKFLVSTPEGRRYVERLAELVAKGEKHPEAKRMFRNWLQRVRNDLGPGVYYNLDDLVSLFAGTLDPTARKAFIDDPALWAKRLRMTPRTAAGFVPLLLRHYNPPEQLEMRKFLYLELDSDKSRINDPLPLTPGLDESEVEGVLMSLLFGKPGQTGGASSPLIRGVRKSVEKK